MTTGRAHNILLGVLILSVPIPADTQVAPTNDHGMKQLETLEKQEHDDVVRTSPPLRFGFWTQIESTPSLPVQTFENQQLCSLRDRGFFFNYHVSLRSGGIGKEGIRVNSRKLAESEFVTTVQVMTQHSGLAIAQHRIRVLSPESYIDNVTMTEGSHKLPSYEVQAHWIKGCTP